MDDFRNAIPRLPDGIGGKSAASAHDTPSDSFPGLAALIGQMRISRLIRSQITQIFGTGIALSLIPNLCRSVSLRACPRLCGNGRGFGVNLRRYPNAISVESASICGIILQRILSTLIHADSPIADCMSRFVGRLREAHATRRQQQQKGLPGFPGSPFVFSDLT